MGFIEAVSQENYTRAARYLNLKGVPRKNASQTGPKLAQALQVLFDQHARITPRALISRDSTGQLNDNLSPDLDQIGTAEIDSTSFPILVEKTRDSNGDPIWQIASETLRRVPALTAQTSRFTVDQFLPAFLKQTKWGGVPVGHWAVMALLLLVAYLLSGLLTSLLNWLIRTVWAKAQDPQTSAIIKAFIVPIRIYGAVFIYNIANQNIGLSIGARQSFSSVTLVISLIAFLLLLWQLIDEIAQYTRQRLLLNGQFGGLSAVLFLRRGIKLILIAFGAIAILNILGWDVTTGLAALGIGGIALALGAQKTVENFVGSLTIIADQPLRIGDFCKVDGTAGTVEQIGIRSTRIRTTDRTLIIIPNGQLAALKIENLAYRDRILFNPTLALRYETTPDQIRYLLAEIRAILNNDPDIGPDPARVRFTGWQEDKLSIEIFSYINVRDYNRYLEIRENLALQIMEKVAESGTGMALSNQALYVGKDAALSEEKTRQITEKVREWRDKGEL